MVAWNGNSISLSGIFIVVPSLFLLISKLLDHKFLPSYNCSNVDKILQEFSIHDFCKAENELLCTICCYQFCLDERNFNNTAIKSLNPFSKLLFDPLVIK